MRRRAAEVINQPGPHAQMALAALKRAYDRPWAEGEPVMMSTLLMNFGRITRQDLANEQLHQLRELHALAKPGTSDRHQMGYNYGYTLGSYGRYAEGIAELQKALDQLKWGVQPDQELIGKIRQEVGSAPWLKLKPNETPTVKRVRFRTCGDMPITGAVESDADTLEKIIVEVAASRKTERGTRADDKRSETAMEDRKKSGYF